MARIKTKIKLIILKIRQRILSLRIYKYKRVSIISDIESFYLIDDSSFITDEDLEFYKQYYKETYDLLSCMLIRKKDDKYQLIQKFKEDYKNLDDIVKNLNDSYYKKLKIKYSDFFSNINGKTLDNQQIDTVIHEYPRILTVAGAGSGKTLVILARVMYLCLIKKIDPSRILLLAYNKDAANEMNQRINKNNNLNVKTMTFHAFGNSIISKENENTNVNDKYSTIIKEYFEEKIDSDDIFIKQLLNYFAYYFNVPENLDDSDKIDAYYEKQKADDYETIRHKYMNAHEYSNSEINKRTPIRKTLNNEILRSIQEVVIANFFFLHEVEYIPEKIYPFQSENGKKMYRPDFYLPEYDIWVEHFGINEKGECPWLSKDEEEKYISDMEWKIEWHKQHKTKLITTYSYYQTQGILLEKLEEELIKNGVKLGEADMPTIFKTVYGKKGDKYINKFIKLASSFMSNFKSQGYSLDELYTLNYYSDEFIFSSYHKKRKDSFLKIVEPAMIHYESKLKENNEIDFSDMINKAAEKIENENLDLGYDHVIVDEFQDISRARYRLLKAVLTNSKAKLFAVGDDWQSINKFAGSDISIFTQIDKYFGKTELLRIEKTYRNSQELIDIASKFVMKNDNQIKKKLKSDTRLKNPVHVAFYDRHNFENTLIEMIEKIYKSKPDGDILILQRSNKLDKEDFKKFEYLDLKKDNKIVYKKHPELDIKYLTIHKSKGLEADNVILLEFSNSVLGMPNRISDDPLLELVNKNTETFPFAEERRLLYVAITRARNNITFMVPNNSRSIFLKEFPQGEHIVYHNETNEDMKDISCPKCKNGILVERQSYGGIFLGCSNFPRCDYTAPASLDSIYKEKCPRCGDIMISCVNNLRYAYRCKNRSCNYLIEREQIPDFMREF